MSGKMVARNSFIIIMTQATSALLGVLALSIISKAWGGYAPGLIGIVWFGLSFVGTFSFIANMGFDAAHVKRISEGKDLAKCNGTFISIKLFLTSLLVLSMVGGLLVWKYVLKGQIYDAGRENVIFIFIGYYAFVSLAQIPIMTFNSLKKNTISQIATVVEPLVRVVLFFVIAMAGIAGAIMVTDSGTQVINLPPRFIWPSFLEGVQSFIANHVIGSLAMAYIIGGAAMMLVGLFFLRRYPVSKPDKEYMSMYMKFALPMMIPIIFAMMISYFDKVIIGYYWTSADVGYYFSVQRVCTMITMTPAAIGIVLFPTISALHNKNAGNRKKRNREIATLTKMSARYTSMITIPIVAAFLVFAIPIIDTLLNSSFRPGAQSMQVLAMGAYLATLMTPYYFVVLGMNKPGTVAKIYMASGITNIILNILFVPYNGLLSSFGIYGATGAAVASVSSSFVMFTGTYYHSKRLIKRKLFENRVLLHLIAGAISCGFMYFLMEMVSGVRWFHLGLFAAAGLAVYIVALWAMGEFRRNELEFFLDIINPQKLFKHVRSEVKDSPKN